MRTCAIAIGGFVAGVLVGYFLGYDAGERDGLDRSP